LFCGHFYDNIKNKNENKNNEIKKDIIYLKKE